MRDFKTRLGALTVAQKALLTAFVLLIHVAIGIAVTAFFLSLQTALAIWGVLFVAMLAAALFMPVGTGGLHARRDPAPDYAAARARFKAETSAETTPINPLCSSVLLDHGEKTETVVVLLHGISSCPHAFTDFGPLLHARGHTVLMPRMPCNGYADRGSDALKHLTAEKLRRYGDAAIDIAAGLGEQIIVCGISAGGTVAGWIGQNRPEVTRTVLVAPFFGLSRFGPRVNMALMRLMLLLPARSIWKDPVLKQRYEGAPHAYKRQSTRGTGEVLRLGLATYRQGLKVQPAAGAAAFVTNANDQAVDNTLTRHVADLWRRQGLSVTGFEFAQSEGLGHEIIDPAEPAANTALTYPVLVGLIEGSAAPSPSEA